MKRPRHYHNKKISRKNSESKKFSKGEATKKSLKQKTIETTVSKPRSRKSIRCDEDSKIVCPKPIATDLTSFSSFPSNYQAVTGLTIDTNFQNLQEATKNADTFTCKSTFETL